VDIKSSAGSKEGKSRQGSARSEDIKVTKNDKSRWIAKTAQESRRSSSHSSCRNRRFRGSCSWDNKGSTDSESRNRGPCEYIIHSLLSEQRCQADT
jgi:hypothetical protein